MQPITPIGTVPTDISERFQARAEAEQLHVINSLVGGAALLPAAPKATEVSAAFDLPSFSRSLENDLRHGFYKHRQKELVQDLAAGRATIASSTLAMLEINEHYSLSQLAEKLSTKLADSINTIVTKQG